MGKSQSKPKTREDLQCKDWKYIEKQDPDKIKYLDKWVKDYGFNGKLNIKRIKLLQETIQNNTNKDPKKMKKSGYEETKYWIKVAEKREAGERDRKNREKIGEVDEKTEKKQQVMFHRQEDDETGPVGRRAEQRNEEGASGGLPPTARLYPDIPQEEPPEYDTTPPRTLRSTRGTAGLGWSKKLGAVFSPTNPPTVDIKVADEYPMIQVANPNRDEGQPPTILVYRTWNMNDVKKALEGITPYKEDVTQFVIDMENVRKSYHLNGQEVQQIWMCALGPDWHNVRGDWNPLNTAGDAPLPWDSQQMAVRVNGLATRATARFKQKANYTEIGRARQKDDETFDDYRHRMTTVFKIHSGLIDDNNDQGAYRQQLKNALHAGSKDAIRIWVQRHYIGLSTGTLDEYINHALHAEKVAKEKKKKTVGTFFGEEETEEVFYHDQNRERGRNNRGRRFHRKGQRGGRGKMDTLL
ncbi:uncharacterized protein LOC122864398 [Siniperca chuatsi]|uniref:uncharacterized protein LOC122864398 n=1 Tax=Siniperca chuatsi TaxID=119488 RepID=UPI001CE19103|nr:uncharacterized protein LOC122864398 [Siniperca chuatsi]